MSVRAAVTRASLAATVQPVLWRYPVPVQRRVLESTGLAVPVPRDAEVHQVRLGDRRAERVSVPGVDESRAVLHLHGGAWMTMSPRTHRPMAAHLSRAAGCPVFVLDQRLAPEHPYPADVDDATAAFDALRVPTALTGDSAGGACALLTAQRLRDRARDGRGDRQPTALGLVSPATDFTMRLARAYTGPDAVLSPQWMRQGRDAYLGTLDPRTVSPLHQELAGLPPTVVHWVSDERLAPESQALVDALVAAGVEAEGVRLPGLWHDVHLFAGLVPEGTAAVAALGAWLRARA